MTTTTPAVTLTSDARYLLEVLDGLDQSAGYGPSGRDLSERTGLSTRTIFRGLRALEDGGLIIRHARWWTSPVGTAPKEWWRGPDPIIVADPRGRLVRRAPSLYEVTDAGRETLEIMRGATL